MTNRFNVVANNIQREYPVKYKWTAKKVNNKVVLNVNYLDGVEFVVDKLNDEALILANDSNVFGYVTIGDTRWDDVDNLEEAYELAVIKVVKHFNRMY